MTATGYVTFTGITFPVAVVLVNVFVAVVANSVTGSEVPALVMGGVITKFFLLAYTLFYFFRCFHCQ
jgi:hypothetical protein